MNIPFLDLGTHHAPLHADIMRALEEVIKSQLFILGPPVEKFEASLAKYCGTRFAIGVASGTDALLVALMALEIRPGDEVITTPYSFFATAGVIARLNARPVFVDIDPESFNIDTKKIESAITSKTRGIIPVHLFGQCAEMSTILELAEIKRLYVVEDAAQALGAQYQDERRAGTLGNAGCFSFFPSKNLGALGDAGAVVTNDPTLAEKVKAMRVHGALKKYHHRWVGGNFRMDTLQAAVLSVKLPHLDEWTRRRQANARYYEILFASSGLIDKGFVCLPTRLHTDGDKVGGHIYNQFVIRVVRRDELRSYLQQKGIGNEVYYPLPLHLQECFKYLGYRVGDFPEAEKAASDTLALPIYPELSREMQEFVVNTIKEFYR